MNSEIDPDDPSYGMVCPFLDQSPTYAHGVEFGMLCARMKVEKKICDYFHLSNQEQILLLANRLGWSVKSMKQWRGEWFRIDMRRGRDWLNVLACAAMLVLTSVIAAWIVLDDDLPHEPADIDGR